MLRTIYPDATPEQRNALFRQTAKRILDGKEEEEVRNFEAEELRRRLGQPVRQAEGNVDLGRAKSANQAAVQVGDEYAQKQAARQLQAPVSNNNNNNNNNTPENKAEIARIMEQNVRAKTGLRDDPEGIAKGIAKALRTPKFEKVNLRPEKPRTGKDNGLLEEGDTEEEVVKEREGGEKREAEMSPTERADFYDQALKDVEFGKHALQEARQAFLKGKKAQTQEAKMILAKAAVMAALRPFSERFVVEMVEQSVDEAETPDELEVVLDQINRRAVEVLDEEQYNIAGKRKKK
jgi:hypothetical protein